MAARVAGCAACYRKPAMLTTLHSLRYKIALLIFSFAAAEASDMAVSATGAPAVCRFSRRRRLARVLGARASRRLQPRHGRRHRPGPALHARGGGPDGGGRARGVPRVAAGAAARAGPVSLPLPRPPRAPPRRDRAPHHDRARQDRGGRARVGAARPRGGGVRVRHPDAPDGRDARAGLARRRLPHDPPAARRRGRHHAVQLPGDGAAVDDAAGDRVRQHVRLQAVREGAAHGHPPRRAPRRDGAAARGGEPGARHGAAGRAAHRSSAGAGGVDCGVERGGGVGLRARRGAGQARAGARRREEPFGGDARRRPRPGGAGHRRLGVRVGRRAVHGRERGGGGGARRRRARRANPGARGGAEDGAGRHAGRRAGAARHRGAPRPGGAVPRGGRRGGRRARARRADAGRGAGLLPRGEHLRPRAAGHADRARGDLRPGAHRHPGGEPGGGAGGGEPVGARQRRVDLHARRRRGAHVHERGRGRHDWRERRRARADGDVPLRRVEGVVLRGPARDGQGRRAVLHGAEGDHDAGTEQHGGGAHDARPTTVADVGGRGPARGARAGLGGRPGDDGLDGRHHSRLDGGGAAGGHRDGHGPGAPARRASRR